MTQYAKDATATEIASFLKEEISKRGNEETGREQWTIAVQLALDAYKVERQKAGEGWLGAEVLPTPNHEDHSKGKKYPFLLDFVLWRRDLDGKEGAWIACESEWNISHHSVIEDFHKLMSFRAPYKLMIYDGSKGNGESCHREFEKELSGFRWHVEDEIYIFLEFVKGDRIARTYTCRPAEEIRLVELKLA